MDRRHQNDGAARARACGTCIFFYRPSEAGNGECRRNAPRPREIYSSEIIESESTPMAFWPSVTPADWCGEHRKKGT